MHTFNFYRPAYKELKTFRQLYPDVPIMCLTATATDIIQKDVISILKLRNIQTFVHSYNRINIKYVVLPKNKNTNEMIINLIKTKFRNKTGIIYCLSKNNCDDLAEVLKHEGIKAKSYHAGLNNKLRNSIQMDWMVNKYHVIVATIAFGMGIDKPDVRYVIHNCLPKSIEAFYQESGRAGRDGYTSYSYLFYSKYDTVRLKRLIVRK